MRFEKGNEYGHLSSGGKPGRSGRKKSLRTLTEEAMERIDQALPNLIDAHIQKGVLWLDVQCPECKCSFEIPGGGDREAREYLIDRRLGKAKAFTEVDLHQDMGAGFVVALMTTLQKLERDMDSEIKGIIDKYFQEHPGIEQPEWYHHLHSAAKITTPYVNPEQVSTGEFKALPEGGVEDENTLLKTENRVRL